MTIQEFIDCIAGYIKKYAAAYNVCVFSPIIAQAILESNKGTSELAVNAHNYFPRRVRSLLWRMRKPVRTRIPATRCLIVRVMLCTLRRASLHSLRIE